MRNSLGVISGLISASDSMPPKELQGNKELTAVTITARSSIQSIRPVSAGIRNLIFALWEWGTGKESGGDVLKWLGAMNVSIVGLQIFRILFALPL